MTTPARTIQEARKNLAKMRAQRFISKAMQFDRIEEYRLPHATYYVSVKPAGLANQVEDRGVVWLPL